MTGYICPFCQQMMSLSDDTMYSMTMGFNGMCHKELKSVVELIFYKCPCPTCSKISIELKGFSNDLKGFFLPVHPNSLAKQFPDYIPKAIREDYEEAYAILHLSPKASATLSRRCLQGMIRDFWSITDKKTLNAEIDALEGKIPALQWKVLHDVRKIGNIGAHMEKDINTIVDIDPNEAEKLIKLIELLIKSWYVNRHEEETLYADIIEINQQKQESKS